MLSLMLVAGCGPQSQRLRYHTERSEVMGVPLGYAVYLPPDHSPDERLPLVVFLHGGGDDERVFDKYAVGTYLDAAIEEGRMPRAIIVLPRGDNGFWVNWHDGSRRYEDWILHEIIPDVAERYHTADCPDGCHIAGVSMGGFGALHLLVRHPGTFASTTVISAPVFDTDKMAEFASSRMMNIFVPGHRIFGPVDERRRIADHDPFQVLRTADDLHDTHLLMAWGRDDRPGIRRTNRKFREHLEKGGIPHEALVFDGGHGWRSWRRVIPELLGRQLGSEEPGRPEGQASPGP